MRPSVGAPMRHALADQQLLHRGLNLVRAVKWHVAPITESGSSLRLVARLPLVADAPAHRIAGAQLTHREAVPLRIAHEL